MPTAADILARHGIKLASTAAGRHYTTCPRCSAKRRSPSTVLPRCSASPSTARGCAGAAITARGSARRKAAANGGNWRAYVYRDADGVPRFRKVRNLPGREPRFWLERADGRGGWLKGTKGVDTKIIYRADEVKKAIAEGRLIACVEGEKDADNLWSIGIAATCNAHGASEPGNHPKWTKAHSEQLADADLVVLNDNDAAGYEHADATCRLSLGIAKRVRRLDLAPHWPDMPKGAECQRLARLGHSRRGAAGADRGRTRLCAPARRAVTGRWPSRQQY